MGIHLTKPYLFSYLYMIESFGCGYFSEHSYKPLTAQSFNLKAANAKLEIVPRILFTNFVLNLGELNSKLLKQKNYMEIIQSSLINNGN